MPETRTRCTIDMDLNTLTISYSLRIFVLTCFGSSVCMSTLDALSNATGSFAAMKKRRNRAARFSSDFSRLQGTAQFSPFRTVSMVSTAFLRPRQTYLFFSSFLMTCRLSKILTMSQILRLQTSNCRVALSSSITMPSLPSKLSMNLRLSSSRLLALRLQLRMRLLRSYWRCVSGSGLSSVTTKTGLPCSVSLAMVLWSCWCWWRQEGGSSEWLEDGCQFHMQFEQQ